MEIIFTASHNNLIAVASLNSGDIFRMTNVDDVRRFGANCLCMKLDTGDFVPLTGRRCGEFCEPWSDLSDCSNTLVEKVSNAAITLT